MTFKRTSNPLLSIVMPVYNGEPYLLDAVHSLLHQTFTDFELLIVDDASTDKGFELLEVISDPRIRILRNAQNSGIVYSRNRGMSVAKGNYIAPFDSDDIAHPRKFEKQIRFLEANPDFGLVGAWAKHIDASGKLLKTKWKLDSKPENIPAIMLFRAYFIQSAVVLRRAAIPSHGYTEGFEIGEDYKLYVEIARNHKTWNLPEYLIHYRIHQKSVTQSKSELYEACERELYKFIFQPLRIEIDETWFTCLQQIKSNKPIKSFRDLQKIGRFLNHIIHQNDTQRIFSQKRLAKVIFSRWIKVLIKSRCCPVAAIYSLFFNPLTHNILNKRAIC